MSTRNVSYSILALGGVATLLALTLSGEGFRGLASGFAIWVILPYIALATAACIARTRGSIIAVLAVSLLAVVVAVYSYAGLFVGHQTSTAALIFVFLPLYQLLAALIVLTFAA